MRKKTKNFSLTLITILTAYMGYYIYTKREEQKSSQTYVHLMLHSYCNNIIQNNFNNHASSFSTVKDSLHEINGVEIFGNVLWNLIQGAYGMHIRGHSTIYFEGYAPQDIYCSANILVDKSNTIPPKSRIHIIIRGIDYLPKGYANPTGYIELTVAELNKLYPLSFGASPIDSLLFGVNTKDAQ